MAGHRPSVNEVRALMLGVVSSRFGLWMFDMAVTQLVQEQVLQSELGEWGPGEQHHMRCVFYHVHV